ncbi:unnamed protein product [Periconia digitata]|uniref:Uncharacterized protein n=1 Tax=Periconia digitata TaxID=1303443 RepID=A0A9W4XPV9_9PLEO|nr:unnamed protein product [Periconia digitata]
MAIKKIRFIGVFFVSPSLALELTPINLNNNQKCSFFFSFFLFRNSIHLFKTPFFSLLRGFV